MKIGIIGAGQIGGTLARRFTELGHQVFIANSRGPQSLADVVAKTGATAVTAHEAARAGDVVVVTIQQARIPELPKDLFAGVPDNVVVIDTGNYYPRERDGRIEGIEGGLLESRWVEQQLGRPVIKAFNNIYAKSLAEKGSPAGTLGRVALPVAGDQAAGKATALKLVEQLGFDAIDAGSTSRGASSPALPSTAKITTPMVSTRHWRKPVGSARRSGQVPRKARVRLLPQPDFVRALKTRRLPKLPGFQVNRRSANGSTRRRALVGIEQEQIAAAITRRKNHAFGQAEAHLARCEVGDEHHVAADQLFRFGVGGTNAGEDLPCAQRAGVQFEAQQLV
jgi:predicted dinucleotide-binding enzyme